MTNGSTSPRDELGGGALDSAARLAPALHLAGISKSFSSKTVLQPFELQIGSSEIHALLGQNGSGKSTLIKILSGFHMPDGGQAEVAGESLTFGSASSSRDLGLRFVHQDLGLVATSSVLDNFYFGRPFPTRFGTISSRAASTECAKALAAVGLDVSPRAPVQALTPAQRTGLAVARALFGGGTPATVLVLDEPTATLPTDEVDHLHSMLRSAAATGVGILYVTHYLDEVYRLADRVSVLRDGYLVGTSPVAEISRTALVHQLIGGELESVRREAARDRPTLEEAGDTLAVRGVVSDALHGVDLEARSGEVLGIYGLTGSGRESVLGVIFGAHQRTAGAVTLNGQVIAPHRPGQSIAAGVGYLPPDRKISGGLMLMTAAENLTLVDLSPFWSRGSLHNRREKAEVRSWFERLEVRPADGANAPLGSFSGGNQQKIMFGKWLRLAPKVLLLDEPTQGVDVGAKAELHRQIMATSRAGAVVVISSSDVEELATLCDRVVIMHEGKVAQELVDDEVTEPRINSASHRVTAATNQGAPSHG